MVVLSTEDELRPGSAQHRFAEKALKSGAQDNMLMAIVLHEPPYSSGKHGSSLKVRQVIHPLARKYGVELVLAGHDHDYERTKAIDGVTYVVSGSGGRTDSRGDTKIVRRDRSHRAALRAR